MVDLPEKGELVVCECTKIMNYGAFFRLVEYGDLEGFVHISRVSSGRVKNIFNYLKRGQLYVAKVTWVDKEKNEINMVLGQVTEQAKTKRLQQWRQDKRSHALLKVISERIGITEDEAWEKIAVPLIEEEESLYKAFEVISVSGEVKINVPKKWKDVLIETLQKSIDVPLKTIKVELSLSCKSEEGVDAVKAVLLAGKKALKNNPHRIYSISAPLYTLEVTAPTYKEAETDIDKAIKVIEAEAKKHKKCEFTFKKTEA
ncbi:MAG: S1 RNA-binding domain-containing protein [Candidatus Diapherotrites archaeon]|nr:S1 RNA-binding domain-containing protein [Candidatus Diapherotrites archaeon]